MIKFILRILLVSFFVNSFFAFCQKERFNNWSAKESMYYEN